MVHGLGSFGKSYHFCEIKSPDGEVAIDAKFQVAKLGPGRYIFLLKGENGNQLRVLNSKTGEWETNDLLQLRD